MKDRWQDNTPYMQAHILAYNQIREYDDNEMQANMMKAMIPKSTGGK